MASAPSEIRLRLRSRLSEALAAQDGSIAVGLSGGLDSSLLLTLVCELRDRGELVQPLRALHIDHGIHADSDAWRAHCEALCRRLGIDLVVRLAQLGGTAAGDGAGGKISEQAARTARYSLFEQVLAPNECLLLGHHLDDQLETSLLRLNRGAGVGGLAGMPMQRSLGSGLLLRPWLAFRRAELEACAAELGAEFITDPSNACPDYDRNLLRNEVLPAIEARWPQYRQSWGKSLQLIAESAELTAELGAIDLAHCRIAGSGRLGLAEVKKLVPARRRNLLRHWLMALGASAPSWHLLVRLDGELACEAGDGGQWQGDGFTLYRYRDELVAVRSDSFEVTQTPLLWTARDGVCLPLPHNGTLQAFGKSTTELAAFHVAYRRGGERIQLRGRPTKLLKKALNEARVPPWLRDRTPLVFRGERLAWVAGLGAAEGESDGAADEEGGGFAWQPPALELRLD